MACAPGVRIWARGCVWCVVGLCAYCGLPCVRFALCVAVAVAVQCSAVRCDLIRLPWLFGVLAGRGGGEREWGECCCCWRWRCVVSLG
jgi:hypothetical protein